LGSYSLFYLRYVLALFLSVSSFSVQAKIKQIDELKLWYSEGRTRIVFDLSSSVDYKSFILTNPRRLVVDFKKAELKAKLPQIRPNDQHVSDLRAGVPSKGKVRVVFELKKKLSVTDTVLTPDAIDGHRLVIDLVDERNQHNGGVANQTHSGRDSQQQASRDTHDIESPQTVLTEPRKSGKLIVAIDAGHGGKDPGAIGHRGSHEKKLTLAIAKKLKKVIDKSPHMQAQLIRSGDYFIELHKRRTAARQINADVFVSIHADAFSKPSAHGFSVFALSQRGATSAMARALAVKENAADLVGGVSLADKDQVLAQVLVDLSMTNTISESVNLGGRVLKELGKLGRLHSDRVEQAGFAVLKSPDIPSILVETGFITNPAEEKKLRSSSYQNKIANAIYKAINEYYLQTPYYSNARYASPSVNGAGAQNASKAKRKSSVHVVKAGDSLSKISAKYNVTIRAIKRLNKLQRDTVYLGQKIKLPSSAKIKKKNRYHKVKRGDTLSEIAEKYNVTITQIMKLNKLRSRKILLGQRLKIPG